MKTLQQHINEKLVINKDIDVVTNLSPNDINTGDKIYVIDLMNKRLTPCFGTLEKIGKCKKQLTIKNNTYDLYSFDMETVRSDGGTWVWLNDFVLDEDFYCFIYLSYDDNLINVSDIAFAFTEDYKQFFLNIVNLIKPGKSYSYKTILRCMGIDENLFVKKYGDKCFEDKSYYFMTTNDEFNDFKNKI